MEMMKYTEALERKAEETMVLVLCNDDKNSIFRIIKCLRMYCGHGSDQAEQCALIAHNKGECVIKHGSYSDLEGMYRRLQDADIIVKLEQNNQ